MNEPQWRSRPLPRAARAVLLLLFGIPLGCPATSTELRIEEIQPTALLLNTTPLRQVAVISLLNHSPTSLPCEARLHVDGAAFPAPITFDAAPGRSEHRLSVPDVTAPIRVEVQILERGSDRLLATREQVWLPQRRWKLFIIESSHEDLGYEDYIFVKQAEIADQIERAVELGLLPSIEPRSTYTYTLETLLFMRNYIEERSLTAWRTLLDEHIRGGRLHLMGAPSGVHSHWMDYEELARMTYGRRQVRDRFNLDLDTFVMVDNPSVSWSAAQAVADAGFSYIARFGQPWRTGGNNDYQTTGLPAVFWWVGPNTTSRILFSWRNRYYRPLWYGQKHWRYEGREGDFALELSQHLKSIESGELLGPYPYDAFLNPDYSDHKPAVFDPEVLAQWHTTYRYPEIRITSPAKFFEYILEHFPGEIPTLTGDLNNFSADYAAIDPESQGWKRRAARLLPLAEGFAAVGARFDPPQGATGHAFDRAWLRLMDYDEHSWPTKPKPSDYHVFNSQWVKHHEGRRALDDAEALTESSLASVLREIPNAGGTQVVVFNPLAHPRTDLATVHLREMDIVDLVTGAPVPSQEMDDGVTMFIAPDIPAFGYKVFGTRPRTTAASPPDDLVVGERSLASRFYHIEFNPITGNITSIRDKELGRELVSIEHGYEFNQVVHVRKDEAESNAGSEYSPTNAVLVPGRAGPVRAGFRTIIRDANLDAHIEQEIVLYRHLKRLDVVNRLHRVGVLFSPDWNDRYRDNLFYAFPLRLDPFEFHVEYPGGVVRPYEDQLRWGSHDYLFANRWVNAGNRGASVTMAPWEAGTVSFGDIRYNEFSIDYKPEKPVMFSYAYANRMAGLIAQGPDECRATLRYSFTSHAGDWRGGATTRFGWQVASPLETRVLSAAQSGRLPAHQASFVSISAPNVQLVTLKQSEQPGKGWIVRLVETEGRDTPVTVTLPHFPVGPAWQCSLIEDDLNPLAVEQDRVHLWVSRYGFATVRVLTHEPQPAPAANVHATALSDHAVRLNWDGQAGADTAWNVFRSDDPGEPPTIHSLLTRTTSREHRDEGLSLGTTYYYRVAPVTPWNTQGPVSPQVRATTLDNNTSPPAPVTEPGIVRRAPDTLILYWRKSPEPDTHRYHVLRSEDEGATFQPVATVEATKYFLQTWRDTQVQPGTPYTYKVLPEDRAGNTQSTSPVLRAITPLPLTPHPAR